jgi:tetratricopeptide (TPR) repeat protein/ADP-heptose:LPS heptosyltransferase
MNDQQANALFEQSVALLQQGKAQEALKILAKLDQAIPSNPGILFFTATGHSIAGNKQKAIQTYERVLRLNPQFIEAYNNIALDLAYLGEHEKAISFIDQALAIRPDFIEAIDNKGCFLNALGNYRAACDCFEVALRINPQDTMALANLSVALRHLGDYTNAKSCAEALLELNPRDYKGHSTLGKISSKLEDHSSALAHFLAANEHAPNDIDTLSDLGSTYAELGKLDLARQYFETALSINPEHAATHIGLGVMHFNLRDFDQALAHFNAPIQDKYRLTLREYNRALTHLHTGNLAKGWSDYSWRWRESELPVPYLVTKNPVWDGHITSEPVFIWHEQGIGDQILFGTLLSEAAQAAPNLIVRLDKRLITLFERSFPDVRFISHDYPLTDNEFNYHLPIGDLARLLRSALPDFDRQRASYLQADSHHAQRFRNVLKQTKVVIGLAWATKGKWSKERNLPIDEVVAVIQSVLPAEFIDLQYSDTTQDRARISQNLGIEIRHLDEVDNFTDLDSLAALITACDLVITCSNSTAHLAGALGKETYLLVPFGRGRHWYWSHIGNDGRSLWYPSVHVIPQTIAGSWADPIQLLEKQLTRRPKLD